MDEQDTAKNMTAVKMVKIILVLLFMDGKHIFPEMFGQYVLHA
jgi:hypothetical protein